MGLDPGTVTTGYGIVDRPPSRLVHVDNGLAVAERRIALPERLRILHAELDRLFEEHRPDVVAVEDVFFNKNVQSALTLGHARGIALLVAAQHHVALVHYSPALVKKTVTGRGQADKFQIQMMVKTLLGLPEPPAEDAADALALAICHCHHETETTIRDRIAARQGP